MRFVPSVNKHGTNELPEIFYEGVMFGVSAENSHQVQVCYIRILLVALFESHLIEFMLTKIDLTDIILDVIKSSIPMRKIWTQKLCMRI